MHQNRRFGNIGEVIHKESSKETKSSKALSLMALSSKGNVTNIPGLSTKDNSKADERPLPKDQKRTRRTEARKSVEIDEFLLQLLMEGLIDEGYWKFHTKCVYTLSLTKYNALVIEARSGDNPKNLLAFKLKGALELHYKKKIYQEKHFPNPISE